MSTTYETITGDTFEIVSRKQYGVEGNAKSIAQANPGVAEPFTSGLVLIIPELPGAPDNLSQQGESAGSNEVAILIDGERFRFWDKVRITRALDSMDIVEFGAPFDSSLPFFREIFKPFSYKKMEVTVGGDLLFTGIAVAVFPILESAGKTITVSGYSKPGVLSDCTAPASAFPLEFDGFGLQEIAETLAGSFGLSVEFTADQGAIFTRAALEPSTRVLSFLAMLAKQRELVISNTPKGALLFQQSIEAGDPIAVFRQGEPPLESVTPFFLPQEYYSHITGIQPTLVGFDGLQLTLPNPFLEGVLRPITFTAADSEDADLQAAVQAKRGRMFGNAVKYSLRVTTWRDSAGALWRPNTTAIVNAPDAMIYTDYEFVIRSVEFNRDAHGESAVLNLVLPGSFRGLIPEALPWDD